MGIGLEQQAAALRANQTGVPAWVCDYCQQAPGFYEPGLQFPTRDGQKVLVHGFCLRPWQNREALQAASVQGGENGDGRRNTRGRQSKFISSSSSSTRSARR